MQVPVPVAIVQLVPEATLQQPAPIELHRMGSHRLVNGMADQAIHVTATQQSRVKRRGRVDREQSSYRNQQAAEEAGRQQCARGNQRCRAAMVLDMPLLEGR